jgi:hypothetical protein
MKKTITLRYLWAVLLLMGSLCLQAQSKATTGISFQAQTPLVGASELGLGSGAQWWAAWPLGRSIRLQAALGYQSYGGYQHGLKRYENSILPNGRQQRLQSIQVNALSFGALDLGLSFGAAEGWSGAITARAARLLNSRGAAEEALLESYLFNALFNNGWSSTTTGANESRSNRLDAELRGYDLGLQLAVRRLLCRGLWVELGAYQGFFDQWSSAYPGSNRLYITSFSLGLAARIF